MVIHHLLPSKEGEDEMVMRVFAIPSAMPFLSVLLPPFQRVEGWPIHLFKDEEGACHPHLPIRCK